MNAAGGLDGIDRAAACSDARIDQPPCGEHRNA